MKMGGYFGGILVIGNQFSEGRSDTLTYINMIQWTDKLHALIQWLNLSSKHNFKDVVNCAIINLLAPKESWQHVTEA